MEFKGVFVFGILEYKEFLVFVNLFMFVRGVFSLYIYLEVRYLFKFYCLFL